MKAKLINKLLNKNPVPLREHHAMHVFPLTHRRRKTFTENACVTRAVAKLNWVLISRSALYLNMKCGM
jgi:hypothetical protein